MKISIHLFIIILAALLLEVSIVAQSNGTNTSGSPNSGVASPTPIPNTAKSEAGSVDEKRTDVQFNYSYESLTKNFGSWQTASIDFSHKFAARQTLYGSYRETERLNQRDREFVVGYYQPLSRKWLLLVEAGASPTHKVLAKWSALVQLERSFKKGWNVQGGYRRIQYNAAKVNLGIGGVEKYWGNYRAAYTLYVNNLENSGTSASHRLQFNRYYGDPVSSVGIGFGFGRELESLGGGRGVLRTDVQSFSFSGRHFFNKRLGLNYGLTIHRQGNLYVRRGGNLGIDFRF
jgi:YaiO family outer membrane protein